MPTAALVGQSRRETEAPEVLACCLMSPAARAAPEPRLPACHCAPHAALLRAGTSESPLLELYH